MALKRKKGFWNYFGWMTLVTLLFTLADALVHSTIEYLEVYYYPVPSAFAFISSSPLVWYAFGKFAGTLVIGSLLYFVVRRIKRYSFAVLAFSLGVTILLEVRYMLSGYYSISWDALNFIQHTIILYGLSYLLFKRTVLFSQR